MGFSEQTSRSLECSKIVTYLRAGGDWGSAMRAGLLCKFSAGLPYNSCDAASAKPLETNDAFAASNHPMVNSRVLSNAPGLFGLLRANSFNLPDKFTERGHIRTTRGRANRNECARIYSECRRRLHPQNRNAFLNSLSTLSPQIVLQMMPPRMTRLRQHCSTASGHMSVDRLYSCRLGQPVENCCRYWTLASLVLFTKQPYSYHFD